jgi:hypothetical protein
LSNAARLAAGSKPHTSGQQLKSAEESVKLEGENEVFEELEDDEIVSLVKSQGIDKSDSEEDAEENCDACDITASQAVFYAKQLEKYALCNPEKFTAEQSLTLADIRRGMQRQQSSGTRQRDTRDMFAPV